MIEKYKKIQRRGSDKLKLNYMNLEIEENKEKDWDRVEIRIQT